MITQATTLVIQAGENMKMIPICAMVIAASLMLSGCGKLTPVDPYAKYIDPGLNEADQQELKDVIDKLYSDELRGVIVVHDVDSTKTVVNWSTERLNYAYNAYTQQETPYYAYNPPSGISQADIVQYALCSADNKGKSGPYYRVTAPSGKYTLSEMTVIVPKADGTEMALDPATGDKPHIYLGGWGQYNSAIDAGIAYDPLGAKGSSGVWKLFMVVANYKNASSNYVFPAADIHEVITQGYPGFQILPGEKVKIRFRVAPMTDYGDYTAILYVNDLDSNRSAVLALRRKSNSTGIWLKDWDPSRSALRLKRMVSVAQDVNTPVTPGQAYIARTPNSAIFNGVRIISSGWGAYNTTNRDQEDSSFVKCRFPGKISNGSTQPVNVYVDYQEIFSGVPYTYKEWVAVFPWAYSNF